MDKKLTITIIFFLIILILIHFRKYNHFRILLTTYNKNKLSKNEIITTLGKTLFVDKL